MGDCTFYERLKEKIPAIASTNIQERYDAYNGWFYKTKDGDAQ